MPKGKPNAQTTASMQYQQKIGLISKSYKIKKSLAEEFKDTCNCLGVGQAPTIMRLIAGLYRPE